MYIKHLIHDWNKFHMPSKTIHSFPLNLFYCFPVSRYRSSDHRTETACFQWKTARRSISNVMNRFRACDRTSSSKIKERRKKDSAASEWTCPFLRQLIKGGIACFDRGGNNDIQLESTRNVQLTLIKYNYFPSTRCPISNWLVSRV